VTPVTNQPVRADVVIVGAGHNGLAMSHELGRRGIDHVLLERGEIANAWRTERWETLRLLTPNWMCRLPGHSYQGPDPDGYMSAGEVADFVCDYARRLSAPVLTHAPVTRVAIDDGGYRVSTPRAEWRARAVVLASGAFNTPSVPCSWWAPLPPACSSRRRSSAAAAP
jgi:putative flavoprotein involved in K+ transport